MFISHTKTKNCSIIFLIKNGDSSFPVVINGIAKSSSSKISFLSPQKLNSRMKLKICLITVIIFIRFCLAAEGIFHIPFQIKQNVMIVQASINGVTKNFIFDTGAHSLVINKKYVTHVNISENKYKISGVNSSFESNTKYFIEDFSLGRIHLNKLEMITLDISLLEEHAGLEIYGLIGYDVFDNYDLFLDYKDSFITFIPYNEFTNYWNMNIINQEFETMSFVRYDHIPVIKAKAGEKWIELGLDTGSARTVLDKNTLKIVHYELSNTSEQKIIGIANKNVTISGAKIRNLKIGNCNFPQMNILINDLSHLQKNGQIDGLIGYDLFSQYKSLISYKNNILVLIK